MAATVEAPVPAEQDSARCGTEEENRGAAVEKSQQPQTGSTGPAVPHSRLSKLPLARIKALMKTDPDVSLASQESVFIIAKATVQSQMQGIESSRIITKDLWKRCCWFYYLIQMTFTQPDEFQAFYLANFDYYGFHLMKTHDSVKFSFT